MKKQLGGPSTRFARSRQGAMVFACGALACSMLQAQGRGGGEWTTSGFDAQRTGAIRTDPRISVQTMQTPGEFGPFKFLWKLKLEHDPKAATTLTQSILLDRLIGFRGFKSIAFVGTASETVHAIDVDFGTPLWKYHINYSASPPPVPGVTAECPGGLTAALSRPTNIAAAAIGGGGGGGGRGGRSGGGVGEPGKGAITLATAGQQRGRGPGGPGAPGGARGAAAPGAVPGSAAAAAGAVPGALPAGAAAGGGGGGRGGPFVPGADAAYVVGSDGYLHALNVQNGWDNMMPTLFLPANTRATGLIIGTMPDGPAIAYAATTNGCGSQPDGVWAMELGSDTKVATAFEAKGARIAGSAGLALGRDGTVYFATTAGPSTLSNAIVALEPKTLKLKGSAIVPDADFTSSPLVFPWKDKDVVMAAGRGKLFLFDSTSLQNGPMATSPALGPEKLMAAAVASWQDAQGTRWVALPTLRGIATFKIAEQDGTLAFQRAWTSRDMATPLAPVVVNGVLFTASSGTRALPAVLYAMDAASGKDLWNSGRAITSTVRGGLSAGQGNVYVPGADSTLYAFGFNIEK
jgi:outer membrane protein assembly factor BamB